MMKLSLIEKYFTPNRILDVGANVGQFYTQAKNTWPESYIFSIEANPDCEEHIKELHTNYKICLLSKDKNEYKYYKRKTPPLQATGNSIYREMTNYFNENQVEEVNYNAFTLDELFSEEEFDLIKIDTQGSELDIMKGGPDLVSKAKGVLLEINLGMPYNQDAPGANEVFQYMEDIGFERKDIIEEHNKNAWPHQQDIIFINTNEK